MQSFGFQAKLLDSLCEAEILSLPITDKKKDLYEKTQPQMLH